MRSLLGQLRQDDSSAQSADVDDHSDNDKSPRSYRRFKQLAIAGALALLLKQARDHVTQTDASVEPDPADDSTNNATRSIGRAQAGALVAIAIMGIVTYRRIRQR